LGFSNLLLSGTNFGPLNDKQQQYLTCISSSGEHLLALINDLLDLSKIEEAGKKFENTSVGECAKQAFYSSKQTPWSGSAAGNQSSCETCIADKAPPGSKFCSTLLSNAVGLQGWSSHTRDR